jgi:phosphoribosylaminoimidazolecarboxamide formyltransferase / IMP cyclohydrolase
MSGFRKISRVLISVSDKTGIGELAAGLTRHDVEIISTGGTARSLREIGFTVTDVSDLTGFPEMMDGRVKTLHPKIHGAFLALRDDPAHVEAMKQHQIFPIDLVVVNLYPFEETIAAENVSVPEAVENIDIGGPAMIRSASKNWRDVAVVTDSRLYPELLAEMDASGGGLSYETRRRLAVLAYTRTASYDLAISSYLAGQLDGEDLERLEPLNPLSDMIFIQSTDEDLEVVDLAAADQLPDEITFDLVKVTDLRYGENPHQRAALYQTAEGGIAGAEQLHGKEMSFNNYVDAEAAWNLVNEFDELSVAIIKHTNPSGVGIGATVAEAYGRALATDPVSAFGGIVAFNRTIDAEAARLITEVFTEVVIAPSFETEAISILRSKKNVRLLAADADFQDNGLDLKQISGGMLVQQRDTHRIKVEDLEFVTHRKPNALELRALTLAQTVCKHVKSNAIVLANDVQTLGVGAGQMNRVDSVRIAAMRADRFELPVSGSALASDAFFPFRDSVDEAAALGVTAIIQPGGSVKDHESIDAANEHGITMAFTGIRHFRH